TLVENKKQFALIWNQCFESGFGCDNLFMSETLQGIRDKIMELTNGKYETFPGLSESDFHTMQFRIIKSHHISFYDTSS
ncbi:MAG: hypothetical protein EBU33_09625, partial [Sphingobacteriia bacterium]|nr:hypothetical protein [Sphingobacteriia bacterium]